MNTVSLDPSVLLQVSEVCPRALGAYLICCQYQNNGVFDAEKSFITDALSLSWTRFKNDVRALHRLGLLEWQTHAFGLSVILPDYQEEDED